MTTYDPPPVTEIVVADQYPNKAIAAAVTTIGTVLVQLATSGWNLSLNQEGITAIGGAVATVLVYAVSNWKRRGV